MSFILDPISLFFIGNAMYFYGKIRRMERPAKVIIGLAFAICFIIFSVLLYTDILPCFFPVICKNLSGSEFMFHSNYTGILKKDVPLFIVIPLFAIYPLWIYIGHSCGKMLMKSKK